MRWVPQKSVQTPIFKGITTLTKLAIMPIGSNNFPDYPKDHWFLYKYFCIAEWACFKIRMPLSAILVQISTLNLKPSHQEMLVSILMFKYSTASCLHHPLRWSSNHSFYIQWTAAKLSTKQSDIVQQGDTNSSIILCDISINSKNFLKSHPNHKLYRLLKYFIKVSTEFRLLGQKFSFDEKTQVFQCNH